MKTNPILLSAFILLLAASPAWAQHNHEHDDHDHSHAEHDHGGHDHHDHGSHGLQLAVEAIGSVAAGAPVTLDLRLTGPDGTAITADDLQVNHEHKLHVLIIDEGLDDFHHLHLDEDENGVFQISFTPQHSRVYRVWVDTQLNEPLPEGHDDHEGHDHDQGGDHDHEHGGHDGDHHDHEGKETATAWIAVGEAAAPYIAPIEVLESEANGYRFTLAFDGHIHAGEPVLMRLSAIDPDGNPVLSYDSYLGAFAHLVGFNRGASAMLHAHPTGAQLTARNGRVLSFDVHIDEPGVHRLFAEMRIGGEKVVASFTVVAE